MEKITLANLPNQEKMLAKGDQILGRLNDQTIVARAVKSVQRGVVTNSFEKDKWYYVTISPVNPDKCLIIVGDSKTQSSMGLHFRPVVVNVTSTRFTVKMTVASGSDGMFDWQVIEFY